jgi:hypothetical protein
MMRLNSKVVTIFTASNYRNDSETCSGVRHGPCDERQVFEPLPIMHRIDVLATKTAAPRDARARKK